MRSATGEVSNSRRSVQVGTLGVHVEPAWAQCSGRDRALVWEIAHAVDRLAWRATLDPNGVVRERELALDLRLDRVQVVVILPTQADPEVQARIVDWSLVDLHIARFAQGSERDVSRW